MGQSRAAAMFYAMTALLTYLGLYAIIGGLWWMVLRD